MVEQFIKFLKYVTNLTPEKRTTLLLFGFVLISGFVAYHAYRTNEKSHLEIKTNLKQKLDTCEVVSFMLDKRIDSLNKEVFFLKIDSAIKSSSVDIALVKQIADDLKNKEKKINTTVNKINKQVKNLKQDEN
jgi:hypothetical protein